jgi:hypothetical protein
MEFEESFLPIRVRWLHGRLIRWTPRVRIWVSWDYDESREPGLATEVFHWTCAGDRTFSLRCHGVRT